MLTESRESNIIICRLVSINGLILEWECADDADFVADNAGLSSSDSSRQGLVLTNKLKIRFLRYQ